MALRAHNRSHGRSTNPRSRAATSEGYVRIRPTWHERQLEQMNAAGFGRITGWLLGAFMGAIIMINLSQTLQFWELLLGIGACSALGALIGHLLAPGVWRVVRPQIGASNPRSVPTLDLRPGQWLMMRDEGLSRAVQVTGLPEYVDDPLPAVRDDHHQSVSIPVSTGYPIVIPADFEVTVVDLAEPVSFGGTR